MSRYILLHDAACSTCARIASEIDELGLTDDGKLELRSLREPAMQALLDKARPAGWTWEPTLMEVDDTDESVRTWTGIRLIPRLIGVVGVRRAHQIARVVNTRVTAAGPTMSRRGLLFKAGAVAAALPLASLTSPLAVAEARPGRGQIGNFDLSPEDAEAAYQIVTSSSDFSTLNQLSTRRDRRSHRARNAPFTRFRAESLNGYGTENATVLPLVEQDGFRIAAVNLAYDESLGTSDELPAGIHAFVDLNAGKLVGMFELQLEDLDRPPGRGHRRDRPAERIRARSRRADGSEKTIEADSRGIYAHQATAGISLDGAIRTPLTAPASSICPVVCSVIQTSICTVICIFASSFCSPLFMGACAAVCSTVACTVYSYYICTELPCVF